MHAKEITAMQHGTQPSKRAATFPSPLNGVRIRRSHSRLEPGARHSDAAHCRTNAKTSSAVQRPAPSGRSARHRSAALRFMASGVFLSDLLTAHEPRLVQRWKASRCEASPEEHSARSASGSTWRFMGSSMLLVALGLTFALFANSTFAQLTETLYTAGTVTRDSQGRDWAYILLQPTEFDLVGQKKIAIYAKAGDAASASPYERKAIIGRQTDPLIIQSLLQRGVNLGDSLSSLDERVTKMFAAVVPQPNLALPEKISAVLRGIADHPESRADLILLGRVHPSMSLVLGLGHGEQIGAGKTTFELREFDVAANRDVNVLGRVTVTANQPTVLPAPGRPVQVPDATAKGHLNARFRWSTPDELNRLTLLNHGFNLYRVEKETAEAANYHLIPPTTAQLLALVGTGKTAWRANSLPILKSKDYTDLNVADFALDPATVFVADDNDLEDSNSVRFANGEEFYYFATARDVLGRDGFVSRGTLVKMCDRLPPSFPRGLKVENDYVYIEALETNHHRLKVTWQQVTNTPGKSVLGYYVYRWRHPNDVASYAGNPLFNRVSAFLPHLPGQKTQSFLDDGVGSPTMPQDAGKTFWYTVVAVDDGACDGGNLSPHSVPVFGVLRDRLGPRPATGGIDVLCCDPLAQGNGTQDLPVGAFDEDYVFFDFVCDRDSRDLAWAEFFYMGTQSSNYVTKVFFPRHGDRAVFRLKLPRRTEQPSTRTFHCRVGDHAGKTSPFAQVISVGLPGEREVRRVQFLGLSRCGYVRLDDAARRDGCTSHNPRPGNGGPGGLGSNNTAGLKITVDLKPETHEYKIYRRVDQGPLTLLKQGIAFYTNTPQVQIDDNDIPANAATICYFAQLFDQHGNNSPMTPIGDCVEVSQPTPQPLLATLTPYGDTNQPQMLIKWFAPPQGIERFEVALGVNVGAPPTSISPLLSDRVNVGGGLSYKLAGDAENVDDPQPEIAYGTYHTPRPGQGFGNGASYEVPVNITPGKKYFVQIVAIPIGSGSKSYSNVRSYTWSPADPADAEGPGTPWPARPLPPVTKNFHTGMVAVANIPFLGGVGIRLAQLTAQDVVTANVTNQFLQVLRGHIDPAKLLYTDQSVSNALSASIIPSMMLYRYQVPNARFPVVSGDIVQVSPLMERIAHNKIVGLVNGQPTEVTHVVDPFVRMVSFTSQPPNNEIYLLDTQPVVRKAAYAYLAVRFTKLGEVIDVVTIPPVEVP